MNNIKPSYKHTQVSGWTLLIFLLVGALLGPIALPLFERGQTVLALVTVALYLFILAIFYALTIEVSESHLSFWFGIGLIKKSYRFEEIQSVTEVKNPWYYLWGIKSIPDGWLYAIGPGTVVELILKSGEKVQLGTNEPQALKQVLDEAVIKNVSGEMT